MIEPYTRQQVGGIRGSLDITHGVDQSPNLYIEVERCLIATAIDLERHLAEAQEKLLAIKGRLLEIVEECEEIGEDPSYLFSMLDVIDSKILEPITAVVL